MDVILDLSSVISSKNTTAKIDVIYLDMVSLMRSNLLGHCVMTAEAPEVIPWYLPFSIWILRPRAVSSSRKSRRRGYVSSHWRCVRMLRAFDDKGSSCFLCYRVHKCLCLCFAINHASVVKTCLNWQPTTSLYV